MRQVMGVRRWTRISLLITGLSVVALLYVALIYVTGGDVSGAAGSTTTPLTSVVLLAAPVLSLIGLLSAMLGLRSHREHRTILATLGAGVSLLLTMAALVLAASTPPRGYLGPLREAPPARFGAQ